MIVPLNTPHTPHMTILVKTKWAITWGYMYNNF
jgi:hypothetical protein